MDAKQQDALIARLRTGDETAFVQLTRAFYPSMLRVALLYVHSRAAAEDVVQDTWLAAWTGLPNFAGRSSFRTWLFHILANVARRRGGKDKRQVPMSAFGDAAALEPAVLADRFDQRGMWQQPPIAWRDAENALADQELMLFVHSEIAELPLGQRAVLTLQDVEDLDPAEVCSLLEINDGSRRVQLHRARARIRSAIERYHSKEA